MLNVEQDVLQPRCQITQVLTFYTIATSGVTTATYFNPSKSIQIVYEVH